MDENILVIGIAGGTGSGKTTLMKRLVERFGNDVSVVSHDNYYRRLDHLSMEDRVKVNYDEPAALETELMAARGTIFPSTTAATAQCALSPGR